MFSSVWGRAQSGAGKDGYVHTAYALRLLSGWRGGGLHPPPKGPQPCWGKNPDRHPAPLPRSPSGTCPTPGRRERKETAPGTGTGHPDEHPDALRSAVCRAATLGGTPIDLEPSPPPRHCGRREAWRPPPGPALGLGQRTQMVAQCVAGAVRGKPPALGWRSWPRHPNGGSFNALQGCRLDRWTFRFGDNKFCKKDLRWKSKKTPQKCYVLALFPESLVKPMFAGWP